MTNTLSERRAKDRETMVQHIQISAAKHGATVDITRPDNRCVMLNIETPQGLGLYIDLDGKSPQPDIFVLPWCLRSSTDLIISAQFGRYQGATVNPHHGSKCMTVKRGFNQLLDAIDKALEMAADGSAFENKEALSA